MSVLKNAGNLIFGQGDFFIANNALALPSPSAYKTARGNGTLATLAGNQGAIKGTVSVQLVREAVALEIGTPLAIVDQTVMREAATFKMKLLELNLQTVFNLIGGGIYSTLSGGATQVTDEAHTFSADLGVPLTNGPVLLTVSTPAATSNPFVRLATNMAGGSAATPFTAGATGTGSPTLVGSAASFNAAGTTTLTVGGTATAANVYSVVIGDPDGANYTVSYTAQMSDTNNLIAAGLVKAINGTTGAGVIFNPFIKVAFSAVAASAVITVTQIGYLQGYDFIIDLNASVLTLIGTGSAPTLTPYLIDYYYNQLVSETLTMGGQANLNQVAIRFYHPYSPQFSGDNRVLSFTCTKANPIGSLTMPLEETAYTETEIEFRAISDNTQAVGAQIIQIYREIPS